MSVAATPPMSVAATPPMSVASFSEWTCWSFYLYLESVCPNEFLAYRQHLFYCFNLFWKKQIESASSSSTSSVVWTPDEMADCISRLQVHMKKIVETFSPLPLWQHMNSFFYPHELVQSWNQSATTSLPRVLIRFQLPKEDIPFLTKELHVADPLLCIQGWNSQHIGNIQYLVAGSTGSVQVTIVKPKRIRLASGPKKYMNVDEVVCVKESGPLNLVIDFIPITISIVFSR